jgi:predicted transcriptional regulator
MVARELIADVIPPLKTSDSVQKVFDRMAEFRISHLPIVNDKQLLGVVSDEDLVETLDFTTPIANVPLSLTHASINQEQHVYEVIRLFYEQRLSVIPVLDDEKNYLGLISINTMMEHIATITSSKEPGGIIVLEVSNRENSLAHMAQIVESNNAQILSSYIQSFPESTKLEVTLKVNHKDISSIVSSFQRYDYHIKETYNDIQKDNGSQDRYDQLMNYLSL